MTKSDRALAATIAHAALEAQAELTGNTYYMVSQKLIELREIVLNGDSSHDCEADKSPQRLIGLAPVIVSLRAKIESELRDNRYYLAAHKLDVLAFIARRAISAQGVKKFDLRNNAGQQTEAAQTRKASAA